MSVTQAVKVATRTGTRLIEASFVGPFAIHRDLNGAGYTVTHAATGRLVETGFCQEAFAKRLAEELTKAADWNFTSTKVPAGWSQDLRGKLRGLCRSFLQDDRNRLAADTKDMG